MRFESRAWKLVIDRSFMETLRYCIHCTRSLRTFPLMSPRTADLSFAAIMSQTFAVWKGFPATSKGCVSSLSEVKTSANLIRPGRLAVSRKGEWNRTCWPTERERGSGDQDKLTARSEISSFSPEARHAVQPCLVITATDNYPCHSAQSRYASGVDTRSFIVAARPPATYTIRY